MNEAQRQIAIDQCAALCAAYSRHADAGDADSFAALFTPDGLFDRLGQQIAGREALRNVIAGRPADVWTEHVCSNIRIEPTADGQSASGRADLAMRRGRQGTAEVEQIRAEYFDRFVLTPDGWRFASRKVVLKP